MFIHIVAFDIPYPANYGGVIVIYYQLKALHARGVKIILHCFRYGGREEQQELLKYCHKVHYYSRPLGWWYQISLIPYIIRTRQSRLLRKKLQKDNYPILFEGMHTAGFMWRKRFRARQKIIRMHNVEWQYYENLFNLSVNKSWKERIYFFIESIKLQRTEPYVLLFADEIIALSTHDYNYYRALKANTHLIPPFHANSAIKCPEGKGSYVLFHGKLSVPDNDRAAVWIIQEVFKFLNIPLVIAGMDPSPQLLKLAAAYPHISLVANPTEREMDDLLKEAQINLLISFQLSGIKLKLINSLYNGRFCIANEAMVSGSGLESLCHVRNSASGIRQTIEALINVPFEVARIRDRKEKLESTFSNSVNAEKMMALFKFYDA